MTGKEFMNKLANGKDDFLQAFVDIINRNKIPTCIIGGLAVNAYVEPVVSLDLDIVVVSTKIKELMGILKDKYHIENYPNSINVSEKTSDLRIQIQTDPRYQDFLERAKESPKFPFSFPPHQRLICFKVFLDLFSIKDFNTIVFLF